MMNNQAMYMISLEDYSGPRYESAVEYYCGTRDEIVALMENLKNFPGASVRYADTLMGVEFYDFDNEITHVVAGQKLSVLTSVEVVRQQDVVLSNQNWHYFASNDAAYPCRADNVEVCRILVKMDDSYCIFMKAKLCGLRVCYPGSGWVVPNIKGFPGMVTWDCGWYCVNLFVMEERYPLDDFGTATRELADVRSIDLKYIMASVLAEG